MSPITSEPIAVIGTACRFPGSSSPAQLWELLKNPKDLLKEIPSSRFNTKGFYRKNGDHHGATNVRHSYLLDENHRAFDASFFNISPREAEAMDPQQRFLLEVVYEATEAAGYPIANLAGSDTSVFVGCMTGDYHDLQIRDVNSLPQHLATGTARSILSNRISYFFDWTGPSMTIDTACSSSLVAIHQAISSLQQGSQMAVVAGANLILGPEAYIFESKLRMLSPTGRSRMWDTNADGYARGEGFAAVILKPLSKAIQDGDSIECIIRGSGVNQDGHDSKGLTAPKAAAQLALIQKTYRLAGLDPRKPSDRCHYFEAHGTGTLVGDPTEAEAISKAFFSPEEQVIDEQRLHVGSIKTVIGHLEGTAGLAGLIKASLMVQHGIIPPNLLFETLNPAITPFYTNLKVPTIATPWPETMGGGPRRVSVNSFGFGGTNAHVIVESYDVVPNQLKALHESSNSASSLVPALPLIVSAKSDGSMRQALTLLLEYLERNPQTNLVDLDWTSIIHRSLFSRRLSFSTPTVEALQQALSSKITELEASTNRMEPISSIETAQPRIFGVFTGQGAQWPTMGRSLLHNCPSFAESIRQLDVALAKLPDAPSWTLEAAMQESETTSQIHLATVSQPICTAVQVALIDLLRSVGLSFSAVIGHSSGEIAAAYAADAITAEEAISIAYYRGFHSHLAAGFDGENGGMMATGYSFTQAVVFCDQDQWDGRLVVAADNGPRSTTLSGDWDAIVEAKEEIEREGVFARILKVNKAYHSHHMKGCSEAYGRSLQLCQIRPRQPTCAWISTVHVQEDLEDGVLASLNGPYWIENMENPVLFAQGLKLALQTHASFDMFLEIGPHPALAGPSKQTIKDTLDRSIPYQGTLSRGMDDVLALSSMIGFLTTQLPSPCVDLRRYQSRFSGAPAPRFLKDFPRYSWDHNSDYWRESRTSERFRTRDTGIHDLLGSRVSDDNDDTLRWSNILRLKELPWASGHCFQNQILFPAAGYIIMALEACCSLAETPLIHSITLSNIQIFKAITLEDASTGIETMFTLTRDEPQGSEDDVIEAHFTLYAVTQRGSTQIVKHFSGSATIQLADSSDLNFPGREETISHAIQGDVDQFYNSMSSVGLDYSGAFRGMTSVRRSNRRACTQVSHEDYFASDQELLMHPGFLDSCLQGLLAAFAAPGDGRFWTAYLPTSIQKAHFNVACLRSTTTSTSDVDSYITETSASTMVGDIEVFDSQGCMQLQLESFACTAIEKASPMTDRSLFAKTVWKCEPANSWNADVKLSRSYETTRQLSEICERLSYFYLKKLRMNIPTLEKHFFKWHLQHLLDFTDHVLPLGEQGSYPTYNPEWVNDTEEILTALASSVQNEVDVQVIQAIGANLTEIFREEKEPLELLKQNDMLTRLYVEGMGFGECNAHITSMATQIAHRYPKMRILEIGAGTGATTRAMARAIGDHYHEYYYTDISAGFFERSKHILDSDKAIYKVLDIEKDPLEQGYEPHSFDLIVSSNALHATRSIEATLKNVRKLMKPGGYLLLMEITGDWLKSRVPMSCLPGWWLGHDEGRIYGATISEEQWHELLLGTGFSGIDRVERDVAGTMPHSMSTILTQGIDDVVEVIRQPLAYPDAIPASSRLVILGGKSHRTAMIVKDIRLHLRTWQRQIDTIHSPEDVIDLNIHEDVSVLSLIDFDEPLFREISSNQLAGLQKLFKSARHVLWALENSNATNPSANMSLGIARSLANEISGLAIQVLHIERKSSDFTCANTGRFLAESLLRLVLFNSLKNDEGVLYSCEPEIMLKDSKIWIPRIVPATEQNDRLNSARRTITSSVDFEQEWIELAEQGDSPSQWSALCQGRIDDLYVPDGHVLVRVQSSLLRPVRIMADTFLFVSVGETAKGERVIVLSQANASVVVVPTKWTVPCAVGIEEVSTYLWTFVCGLVSRNMIDSCSKSSITVVCDPDERMQEVLEHSAAQMGRTIRIAKSKAASKADGNAIIITRFNSMRQIKALLPRNISTVFDLSESAELFDLVARCASPATCHGLSWMLGAACNLCNEYSLESIQSVLNSAAHSLQSIELSHRFRPISASSNLTIIEPSHIVTGATSTIKPFTIMSYEGARVVEIRVNPVDETAMFNANKTYLLVGLAGDLGRSIASWMVEKGAQNIVLGSRNPDVQLGWIQEMKKLGATVKVLSMNVADMNSVRSTVATIRATMPPIGGVANGAMVLSDQTFVDMTTEEMEKVIQPKVVGSECLDQIFYSDSSLEFFVLFSSLATVIGNVCQSNYNAANTYMASLVRRRKRRGLAASIIDVGMVIGLGYLERNPKYVSSLERLNFMPISECDLHTMFAEAVIAGRAGAEEDVELIVGLSGASNTDKGREPPAWFKDPRFSHLLKDERGRARPTLQESGQASLPEQLSTATDKTAVLAILDAAIKTQLALQLQMSADDIHSGSPLTSLGIDSLIAVDFRMWLLATIDVDVPLFKLLSGIKITQISADIAEKLFPNLVPKIEVEKALEPQVVTKQAPDTEKIITIVLDTLQVPLERSSSPEQSELSYVPSRESALATPPTSNSSVANSVADEDEKPLVTASATVAATAAATATATPIAVVREGPVSAGQGSLLFMQKYSKDRAMSNICIQFKLTGHVSEARFERAIQTVIGNHEILRTAFVWDQETSKYIQKVLKHSPFQLRVVSNETDIDAENKRLLATPFDLKQGHSMDATLISQSATIHYAIFCYHHVIMDGISWRILMNEMHQAYVGSVVSRPLCHQIDYAHLEIEMADKGQWATKLDYWQKEFAEPPDTLPLLPVSRVSCRQTLDTYDTSTVSLSLSADTAARIRTMSRKLQVTPFQFYLSVLQVLLHRFTNASDLCIGVVDANRSEQSFANTIGYFIDTLPLRFKIDSSSRFKDVATQTQSKMNLAMANAGVPSSKLFELLKIQRTTSHSPLFQVLVNYRLGALEQVKMGDCELSDMKGNPPKTPYDLTALIIEKSKGECLLQFDVQKYLYSDEDSLQLLRCYSHLLETFSQASEAYIGDCEMFSPAMRNESLRYAMGTVPLELDESRSLLDLINKQFRTIPQDVAMKDGYGTNMSYDDVQKKVEKIMSRMKMEGVKPSTPVGLLCEPSTDAICALLAIWAYPAICVPLDLSNPVARLNAIIEECQPTGVIFHSQSREVLSKLNIGDAAPVDIDSDASVGEKDDGQHIKFNAAAASESVALVLYTSGSTGRPKGVALTHLNLVNAISGIQKSLNLGKETVLQQSSLGFDLAIAQMMVALIGGGTMIIARREQRGDALELSKLMRTERVSFTFCVPSEYSILLRFGSEDLKHCQNWRVALSAGERLTARSKREFRKLNSNVELFNAYGPAETTIISHLAKINYENDEDECSEEFLSVGRPLPNFLHYIVDEAGKPVPIGFPGEVYIGGPSVSPGYYQNEQLNTKLFLQNRFGTLQDTDSRSSRLYKSGDRGRLLADGSLVPLGRTEGDQQIKLRGMRVDLESIESSIVTASRGVIQEAVIVQRGDPAFLAGFVVFDEAQIPQGPQCVLQTIITELPEPEYMRPTILVPLKSFPRTVNGKADRAALKKMVIERVTGPATDLDADSLTPVETTLMALWRQVLFNDELTPLRISKQTDFFSVGGSSLLLVELQNLIQKKFATIIPLKDLFMSSSLGRMAKRISNDAMVPISTVAIDWDAETAVPAELHEASLRAASVQVKFQGEGLHVALTGAFGYLGSSLLANLVANPAVSKISCLAVRSHHLSSPNNQSSKVVIYPGDLSKPSLGLSEDAFHQLSNTVDAIIHNGADVSFLKDYTSLKSTNFTSTQDLVRMSLPRKIPIHYISTTGIAQLLPQAQTATLQSLLPSQLPKPTATTSGYISSKYASERYLERACSTFSIPVSIYRPSNIVESLQPETSGAERCDKDLLATLLCYSRTLRKAPLLKKWSGNMDLTLLKTVSDAVTSSCVAGTTGDDGGGEKRDVKVVHLGGEKVVPFAELKNVVSSGEEVVVVEEVEIQGWLAMARKAGMSEGMARAIEELEGVEW